MLERSIEPDGALDAVDVAGMPLYIGARKSRSVSLSRRDMTANLAGFARAWADLKDGVAACRVPGDPSGLCGWCPLVNPCPVAAREGKGPRVAGLPLAQELGIPVWPAAEPPAQPRAGHVRTSGRKATGAILDDYEQRGRAAPPYR